MLTLQATIKSTVGWCLSLGTKIIRVTPTTSITVQSASFAAQIFLLLTFFLPLKVLILLGSDTIPHYYPLYLRNIKKTHLIAGLSVLALLSYLLYMLSELIIFQLSKKGAQKLLLKSAKLKLFNDQVKLSTKIYTRFNRGLAAGIFSFIALGILLYIYPLFFLAITVYLASALILTIILSNTKPNFRTLLISHNASVLNGISSVGFLIVFFFMVVNFLYFEAPKVFAALISLILMRQALSRLTLMIQDIIALRSQHRQINALFFYGQQLSIELTSPASKIKHLLEERVRNAWIIETVNSFHPEYKNLVSSTWHQLGNPEIYAFEIELSANNDLPNKRFLIKLFDENISYFADQEATLIRKNPTIPALKFCGSKKIESLNCHVFELGKFSKISRHEAQSCALSINKKLISIQPSETLAMKFSRSHVSLEGRLHPEILDQLSLVVTRDQASTFERFSLKYVSLAELLSRLPKQIICLDLSSDTLHNSKCGEVRVSHWANWKIEPVGSNWPVSHRAELIGAIEDAKKNRPDLNDIDTATFILCALTYTFERLCARSNFVDAVNMLPEILEQLESAQTVTIQRDNTP